ncbi:hypothetical protein N8009_01965 [Flavobacteriaceae bacterium]|nr:hypothetical protein [Flavobacteriaceae bacterium]
MKNTILKLTLILAIAFVSSCRKDAKQKTDELNLSEQNGIALNDGNRWIANPETTEGIKNIMKIMNTFNEKEDINSYATLTESLKSEFSMVFEKCTMKGEAHNQLHNFLIPINDLFEPLASSDLKKCQESYDKLNSHLKVYQTYFK